MNNIVVVLLLLVLVAILVTALVLASTSAKAITKITPKDAKNGYKSNSNLKDAHSMLTWLAVGGWITVILIGFGLVIFLFTGGKEKIAGHTNPLFVILLIAVTGLVLVIGVLSILASENLKKAATNPTAPVTGAGAEYSKARKDAVLAAALSIGSLGLIVLFWIIFIAARHASTTSKEKAQEAKIEEEVTGVSAEEKEAKKKARLKEIKEEQRAADRKREDEIIEEQVAEIKAKNEAKAELDSLTQSMAPTGSNTVPADGSRFKLASTETAEAAPAVEAAPAPKTKKAKPAPEPVTVRSEEARPPKPGAN